MVQASPSLQAIPSTGKPGRQVPVTTSQISAPLQGSPSSQSGSAPQQPGAPTAHVAASAGDACAVTTRATRAMARRTPSTAPESIADMSTARTPFRAVAGAGRDVRSAMRRPCAAAPGRAKDGARIRVSLTWLMLAALVAAAGLPERAHADAALLAGASPRARKVRLRVGERQRFAAPAVGGEARCTWRLDDQTVPGMALTWDFVPTPAHMGAHRVTLRLDGSAGFAERWWAVRVEPPRPPRVEVASPVDPALEVAPDQAVELVLRTRPSADGETVRTSWTVDGVLAGEGERLELTPSRLGRIRVRALATGSLGSATAREWEIDARPTVLAAATPTTVPATPPTLPPPPPTTAPVATTTTVPVPPVHPTTTLAARPSPPQPAPTSRPAPPRATTTTLPTVARATPPTTAAREVPIAPPRTLPPRVASVPPSTAPAPSAAGTGISTSEIEVLLQRYAAAWRKHDVGDLRRLRPITREAQAPAPPDYFARVDDLDVEVQLL